MPYAQVLSIEEAMAHPHLREREVVRTVNDRFLGEFEVPGFPLRFSNYARHPDLQAPTLGEHNDAILQDYLQYSPQQIAALEHAGVLHQRRSLTDACQPGNVASQRSIIVACQPGNVAQRPSLIAARQPGNVASRRSLIVAWQPGQPRAIGTPRPPAPSCPEMNFG